MPVGRTIGVTCFRSFYKRKDMLRQHNSLLSAEEAPQFGLLEAWEILVDVAGLRMVCPVVQPPSPTFANVHPLCRRGTNLVTTGTEGGGIQERIDSCGILSPDEMFKVGRITVDTVGRVNGMHVQCWQMGGRVCRGYNSEAYDVMHMRLN